MTFKNPHTLMVQGTTSDAGKSILVTALCRILARHQLSVAPFKSQNMALNSAVTAEGGEIGRAQAVQAQACYLSPSIAMNPVLLKPNSDLGSQVIVNGKAIGNMPATQYHRYKPELLKTVVAAHQQLQQQYQVVVVEGAGSPAEINLREHDIANMGFAEAIDCPVIIVADIDRGGVFAHLYGTYALLSETEKKRVKGFVINRFRGDVTLLESGLTWLQEKTSVPTLAVIPYIPNLHIEAEDSLAQVNYTSNEPQTNARSQSQENYSSCRIAIPMYPRASNHTDFDVLRMHPQIECEFYKDSASFTGADMIILPGSKNVSADLQWLKDSGWQTAIQRHRRLGGKVIGICGGYQMLGQWIHDPDAIESSAGSVKGLGLFNMETTLTDNKTLRNVEGFFVAHDQKIPVKGYEIHAGVSQGAALKYPLLMLNYCDQKADAIPAFSDGALDENNDVMGTYVHGFFDHKDMLAYCLQWAGTPVVEPFDYEAYKDQEINRLADAVESVLPLKYLLSLLGLDEKIRGDNEHT